MNPSVSVRSACEDQGWTHQHTVSTAAKLQCALNNERPCSGQPFLQVIICGNRTLSCGCSSAMITDSILQPHNAIGHQQWDCNWHRTNFSGELSYVQAAGGSFLEDSLRLHASAQPWSRILNEGWQRYLKLHSHETPHAFIV